MNWRWLSYSISLAIIITAVSHVLDRSVGEFLILPGLFGQMIINGPLLAIPTGDDFYTLPSGSYLVFNVAFYALIIFATFSLLSRIRDRSNL